MSPGMDPPRPPSTLAERLKAFRYHPEEEVPPLAALPPQGEEGRPASVVEEVREVLSFDLGERAYAVALGTVLEILRARPLVEIPRADPPLLGVLDVRGTVTPVYDLALALGLEEKLRKVSGPPEECEAVARDARILVARTESGPVGLWVDRVRDVIRLPLGVIEVGAHEPPGITGRVRRAADVLVLLDPEQVL
jgi:purine-binding chemotaxis protein CheW